MPLLAKRQEVYGKNKLFQSILEPRNLSAVVDLQI